MLRGRNREKYAYSIFLEAKIIIHLEDYFEGQTSKRRFQVGHWIYDSRVLVVCGSSLLITSFFLEVRK